MAGERPEIVFGSNVAVWKNSQGRSITIKPRQYQDKSGEWKTASGWNASDIAHLSHCLLMALDYCLHQRAQEGRLPIDKPPTDPPKSSQEPPQYDENGVPF